MQSKFETQDELKKFILEKHPSLITLSDEQVNGLIELFELYNSRIGEVQKENDNVKALLNTRISELYKADEAFCKDRWDMTKHELERSVAREFSNSITMARQEFQAILKQIK